MLHLGDITKISGYTAPIVDVVVGGSPCQDLSVAGKRAGLDGERSGLFMEQLRIVKEMRERDAKNGRSNEHIRPRYMVWENVPGAFSSNKSEDFRIVLEEIAKVKDKDASIPMPDKSKWTTSGCIMGDGWSIAWRVLDAQFYGVPQRRRRIALVADFGGQSAPEILFIRKSVSRDTEQSQSQRKNTPTDASGSFGADDIFCIDGDKLNKKERIGGSGMGIREGDKQYTLTAKDVHGVAYCMQVQPIGVDIYNTNLTGDKVISLVASGNNSTGFSPKVMTPIQCIDQGGGKSACNVTMVMQQCYSKSKRAQSGTDFETWKESDVANTLNAFDVGDKRTTEVVVYQDTVGALCARDFKGVGSQYVEEDKLVIAKDSGAVAYGSPSEVAAEDCRNCTENPDVNGTLQSHMSRGSSLNLNNVVRVKYIVRRLTPLECERLQGYPDGWTDIGEWTDSKGKMHKTSDAARYKALGNSIALPPWKWVLKRLCACYERDATMASLFDGIGGFPLIWEQLNGKGSCLWASEIEVFPIAVTKKRIGG